MNTKIFLDKEFERIWQKIDNNENFTLLRYGDGERAIMQGREVIAQEGWKSPKYISTLGKALLDSLNLTDENVFYGISCPCCDAEAYYWYSTRITNKNRTFANIFINKNYQRFISNFDKIHRNAIIIGNFRGKNEKIGNLKILKYYPVPDDCFDFWENDSRNFINNIKQEFGTKKNLLYVVSAGPMSEPIIAELYRNNPENCYIDFGSSIDKFIHKKQTRPYENPKSEYAKRNCEMDNPYTTNFDVSVVLTLYKRPENLSKQLKAIENQSLKPKEILLFQDKINNSSEVEIPKGLHFDKIEKAKSNVGVWGRFKFAEQNANSKYVCIFDDDTIPAKRWIENCFTENQRQQGLYGAIGIICKDKKYDNNTYYRIGWNNNNEITMKVDFAGHSWFLEKDWLKFMFEGTEDLQSKICGEDMTLSFKLQQHGIDTFVPPQPVSKPDFISSLEGAKLGTDENSLFVNNGYKKMTEIFDLLIQKYNFKPLKQTDEKLHSAYIEIIKYLEKSNCNKKNIKSLSKRKMFYFEKTQQRYIIILFGIKISFKYK